MENDAAGTLNVFCFSGIGEFILQSTDLLIRDVKANGEYQNSEVPLRHRKGNIKRQSPSESVGL